MENKYKKLLTTIEKIITYDLKNDEKIIYQRDLKEILEMINEVKGK